MGTKEISGTLSFNEQSFRFGSWDSSVLNVKKVRRVHQDYVDFKTLGDGVSIVHLLAPFKMDPFYEILER